MAKEPWKSCVIPAKEGIHGVARPQYNKPHGFRVRLRRPGMTIAWPTEFDGKLKVFPRHPSENCR